MNRTLLLEEVKQAICQIEPAAEIILYGSRSRGDARSDSDWDFLILLEGKVDDKRIDAVRHQLYRVEWEREEVLCSIVRSRKEWDSPLYQALPLHKNVEREGLRL